MTRGPGSLIRSGETPSALIRRRLRFKEKLLQGNSPMILASASLLAIQVGNGVLFKVVQVRGSYSFSPSSVNCMSELLKFVISGCLLYSMGGAKSPGLSSAEVRDAAQEQQWTASEGDEEMALFPSNAKATDDPIRYAPLRQQDFIGTRKRLFSQTCQSIWRSFPAAMEPATACGFVNLAYTYALLNNLAFVLYKIADPGTIALVKSSTTIVSAIIMLTIFKSTLTSYQWAAVTLQVCGLVVTQYRPTSDAFVPYKTFALLMLHVVTSAGSGVYNSKLYKELDTSIHVGNMVLYGAGAVFNFVIHVVLRYAHLEEFGFFVGYDKLGPWLMIFNNAMVGLTITAVYKYADAIVRCMVTAVATGVLICLSHILFQVELHFFVVPGTITVFLSIWLYTKEAALHNTFRKPQIERIHEHIAKDADSDVSNFNSLLLWLSSILGIVVICIILAVMSWMI